MPECRSLRVSAISHAVRCPLYRTTAIFTGVAACMHSSMIVTAGSNDNAANNVCKGNPTQLAHFGVKTALLCNQGQKFPPQITLNWVPAAAACENPTQGGAETGWRGPCRHVEGSFYGPSCPDASAIIQLKNPPPDGLHPQHLTVAQKRSRPSSAANAFIAGWENDYLLRLIST